MTSPEQKERYFADVARATFNAFINQPADPRAMLAELATAAGERRVLVWSAHPDEEARILGTVLAGVLPIDDGYRPTVGVFLDDGSGAKLDYYLTEAADLSVGECLPDGRRQLGLRVTLTSNAPSSGLPPYVLGLGLAGDPYTMRTNLLIFSPTGGAIVDAQADGMPVSIGVGAERGRKVAARTVDLKPGATQTLEFTLLTAALSKRDTSIAPQLWTTPGLTPWQTTVDPGRSCAGKR
jgi:hypothetical protein